MHIDILLSAARPRFRFRAMTLFLALACAVANGVRADSLPRPENVRIEGDTLRWDAVSEATGYNIYLGFRYYDTVRGALEYRLDEPGSYYVVAFDGEGNFSSQFGRGAEVEYAPDDAPAISITATGATLVVQKTCTDVAPGESCIAACPERYDSELYGTLFSRYISGGACSTSDIVEADAFVSDSTYSCTVPTFSGEVVAQAVCVHF